MHLSAARERVLLNIVHHRDAQDAKWGGPAHDDLHLGLDWVQFIRYQLDALPYEIDRAQDDEDYDGIVRRRYVKIAALAVAALESFDRKGGTVG